MHCRRLTWRVLVCGAMLLTAGCASRPEPAAEPQQPPTRLSRTLLDRSLALGRQYLLCHQQPFGNFDYEYDLITGGLTPGDNVVRQAGALWGLARIHQARPTPETARAVMKGLAFFAANSRTTDKGLKFVVYPGESKGATGGVALVTLALIDFLRAEKTLPQRAEYERELDGYVRFLLSLRMTDGRFCSAYNLRTGKGFGAPSSYFDGEALLALAKAVKYSAYTHLQPLVLESAEAMYQRHIHEALKEHSDSPVTKGFYQWSSMAYYEIYTAQWAGSEPYARRVIDLAHWMIDTHRTLTRTRNTAYAVEGLAVAWELARLTGDHAAREKLGAVIYQALYKLITWQAGSPTANWYLRMLPLNERGTGGVMNDRNDPRIRIDVVQHQMHAVLLVRRFLYQESSHSDN